MPFLWADRRRTGGIRLPAVDELAEEVLRCAEGEWRHMLSQSPAACRTEAKRVGFTRYLTLFGEAKSLQDRLSSQDYCVERLNPTGG